MTPEQLVMRLIEEETARLNAVLDAQLAEVEVAAREMGSEGFTRSMSSPARINNATAKGAER